MKVAVVIPCHNVERHIEGALRSVFEQTHQDLDVQVIDDGSTDGTCARLAALENTFPGRFRWRTGPRAGACAARNKGLALTTGEYVQFLDADDALMPGKIAGQVALVEATNGPALVVGGYRNIRVGGVTEDIVPDPESPWMGLIRTRLGTTSSGLWQRETLVRVRGWDEALRSSQDYDLSFRIMREGGRVVLDPRILSIIHKRGHGSIGRSDEVGNWERYIALRVAIRDHLRTTDPIGHASEIAEVDQYIFRAIRAMAVDDRPVAERLFARHVPPDFRPQAGEALSRSYAMVYKWLGFRAAEIAAGGLDILRCKTGRR